MKNYLVFILLLSTQCAIAQETAPTLSLGLDQVLFKKGTLDVELIASMIAEKQDELKKRIVEKEILKPIFKNSSFATKNYVFSVIKNLMNEKDKNVLKKEILEHTSNYAVIYILAEMYTQLTWDKISSSKPENDYLHYIFNQKTIPNNLSMDNRSVQPFKNNQEFARLKLTITDSLTIRYLNEEKQPKCVKYNNLILDMVFHAVRNNPTFIEKGFCNKPLYFNTDEYRLNSTYQQLKEDNLKLFMYRDIYYFIRDVASYYENFDDILEILALPDASDASDKIQFIANQYKNRLTESKNALFEGELDKLDQKYTSTIKKFSNTQEYNKIIKALLEESKTNLNKLIDTSKLKLSASHMELDTIIKSYVLKVDETESSISSIENSLKTSIEEYNAIIKLKKYHFNKTENDTIELQKIIESINSKKNFISKMPVDELLDKVLGLMDFQLKTIAKNSDIDLTNATDTTIKNLLEIYYFIKFNKTKAGKQFIVDRLEKEIIPSLAKLNLKTCNKIDSLLSLVESLTETLDLATHQPFSKALRDGNLSDQFSAILKDNSGMSNIYMEFFKRLDKLDETETYYYLLKNLLMAGDQLENRDVANGLNLILHAIEKYTSMDAEDDLIKVDVESIILALFERYGNRDKNALHFYCTVGLNNAFALNNHSLLDASGSPVNNFSFASEKIGLRINIVNFQMRRTYLNGEKRPRSKNNKFNVNANYKADPIVSNLHLLVYGSGLLYQLTDLSTSKNLNTTFLGTGLGVTFYNNLSFNTSFLFPVKQDEDFKFKYPMINLGFDIYFSEYLSALNKKRKENKLAKEKQNTLEKASLEEKK